MMKRMYFMMAALFCAVALFSGCSDDDDNDGSGGNGQGAGNGGSGVTVLPKKIAKIVKSSKDGNNKYTYFFQYDSKGRLSKVTKNKDDHEYVQEISYTDTEVTVRGEGYTEKYPLQNGRVVSYNDEGPEDRYETVFSYSGNYLSKIVETSYHKAGEKWEATGEGSTSVLTVKDGKLTHVATTAIEFDLQGNKETYTYTTLYEYGNTANNANIDLVGFMNEDYPYMLCLYGARYQNLPSKVTEKEEGDADYIEAYTYEVDKEGYVTKITETDSYDGDSEVRYFEITYE